MTAPSLGARARVLADVLAALFEHDRELAGQLNAAQQRLQEANARVAGELADAIHRAFAKYQSVAEQRRQLGADVGEAAVRLIDARVHRGTGPAGGRVGAARRRLPGRLGAHAHDERALSHVASTTG